MKECLRYRPELSALIKRGSEPTALPLLATTKTVDDTYYGFPTVSLG